MKITFVINQIQYFHCTTVKAENKKGSSHAFINYYVFKQY